MNINELSGDTFLICRVSDLRSLEDNIVRRLKDTPSPTAIELPDKIELPEACAVLGKSKSWVYQNKDIIPHSRYRRKLIFSRRELTRWIAENTKRPISLTDEATAQLQKEAKKKKL